MYVRGVSNPTLTSYRHDDWKLVPIFCNWCTLKEFDNYLSENPKVKNNKVHRNQNLRSKVFDFFKEID